MQNVRRLQRRYDGRTGEQRKRERENKTVVVGMSGGVDSSVAAYLLKQQGYEVIGVTMEMWRAKDSRQDAAPKDGTPADAPGAAGGGSSAAEDAARVAKQIGIRHYVVDFHREFREFVQKYFVEEYLRGRTPNPCIACNRHVKWEALMRRGEELGADCIATGHYAGIVRLSNGRYTVCNSVTARKDQTYVLYELTQEQLAKTLMPLGQYTKEEIREIARGAGLFVADKKDSQDICFIPDNDYGAFVEREAGEGAWREGDFVLSDGTVVGRHRGICHYTVGQRKGLGIALGRPVFVQRIDAEKNQVVLGEDSELFTDHLYARQLHPMAVEAFEDGQTFIAKIRYSHRGTPCRLTRTGEDEIRLDFTEPVRAVTPGQAAVLYQGAYVAGGGVIV